MIRLYVIGLCFLVGNSVHASQIHILNEEREIEVEVSNTELNRIIVEKDRISDVFAHGSSLELLPDERVGQIFVKPFSSPRDGIRLTLTTEDGRIQDMRLLGKAIQGQAVILRENAGFQVEEKVGSEQEVVVEILSIFLKGEIPPGFTLIESYEEQKFYSSERYTVEALVHHNLSKDVVHLEEGLFNSDSYTRAILIGCLTLEPGGSTPIWRVSTRGVTSHD